MESAEIFGTLSKEKILGLLENASLDPVLLLLISNDDESYNLFLKIINEMTGALEERVLQLNRLSEVISSVEDNNSDS